MEEKIVVKNIDELKFAPFNPPNRTETKSLGELMGSLKRVGQLYPILVTKNNDVIDGHRRIACMKSLGNKTIKCIIINGDRGELFTEVNQTSKKMTLSDDLFVYLTSGTTTKRSKRYMEELSTMVGRDGLEYLADRNISPRGIYNAYREVNDYLKEDYKISSKQIIYWLVDYHLTYTARTAMYNNISKQIMVDCIKSNQDLRPYFNNVDYRK